MEQGKFNIKVPEKAKKEEQKDERTSEVTANKQEVATETDSGTEVLEVIEEIQENIGDNSTNNIQEEKAKGIPEASGRAYPEGIDKLASFMDETGGTIEDYVKLNVDVDSMDDVEAVREYYKRTKPHLNSEDLDFYIEDRFVVDEDLVDEREAKLKRIAFKEEAQKAREYVSSSKEKYYANIQGRQSQVDPQTQKALDFFNRYNKEQDKLKTTQANILEQGTKFLQEREGFDFDLGEKKVKFKFKDAEKVATEQSNISDFVQRFVDKEGKVDYGGYHKAMYTARNADKIAKSFYEQGRADMAKEMTGKGKNISTEAKTIPKGTEFVNGMRFKVLSGDSSKAFKINKK